MALLFESVRYNPVLPRWVNRDPLNDLGFHKISFERWVFRPENELNGYLFVDNSPVGEVDSFGLINWGALGGQCCNKGPSDEWAIVGGGLFRGYGHWKKLSPGGCTGGNEDCDGMTCQGKFYKLPGVNNFTRCPDMNEECGTGWPGGTSPSPRLMVGNEDPPLGYGWLYPPY